MIEISEREKFLLDLQGFLHVENVLTPEEVQVLNDAVDAHQDEYREDPKMYGGGMLGTKDRRSITGMLTWEQPHCQPFRDLIAHPKLVPYLNTVFGRGWRMDSEPLLLVSTKGSGGHGLHGFTNRNFNPSYYYTYTNGEIRAGQTVFQLQLRDIEPDQGGLAVIPGSHKANFKCPEDIMLYEADRQAVYQVASKAGDLVLFFEATIHGSLPWTADYDRRSLLYRYNPKSLQSGGGLGETRLPEWIDELTEAQRAAVEPPYMGNRPLIEDDGFSVVQPGQEPIPHIPRSVAERGY